MAMNADYLDAVANAGAALISHIGLVDDGGLELTGGDPAYARLAVTWTTASGNGTVRPTGNLTFDIPASTTVSGWRGYSALTDGTDYGGQGLTPELFAGQGQYTLLAASTGIVHSSP